MDFGDHKALWQARRATRHLLHGISNVRLLTQRLKEMAESMNPTGKYWGVPLALDPPLYTLQPPAQAPVIGLTESMPWEPSRSAAERLITRIWPLVKQGFPQAKLYVAGWNAAKYLNQYSTCEGLQLGEHPA